MDETIFEWNADKARINLKKHGVSFDEGATIFNDPMIATMPDSTHSEQEPRFIAIGMSANGRLLVVVFTERGDETRLVSCRKATKTETESYETL
jgi:uncharacterized DUF497 family protein